MRQFFLVLICFLIFQPQQLLAKAENKTLTPLNIVNLTPANDKIESVTKQILLKSIELEKLNLYFRLNAGTQGRWKGLRYFLSQETNFGLTEAGVITGAYERLKNIHEPHHPNRSILKEAAIPQIIGPIIASIGSGVEFSINAYHQYQAYKLNLSPGLAKKRIYQIRDELNTLMKEHHQLIVQEGTIANLKTPIRIALAEENVLRDIINLSIIEYHYFHMDTRRLLAFQQSLYLLDIAKNSIASIANYVSYRSELHNISALNQPLGILTIISGSLIVATPIISRVIGKMAYKYHESHLDLPRTNEIDFANMLKKLNYDRKLLISLLNAVKEDELFLVSKPLSRMYLYSNLKGKFRTELNDVFKLEHRGVLAATETVFSGAFTGSTKVTNGCLLTVAGSFYNSKPYVTNSLLAAGATTYIAGNSLALIDNARIQIENEWNYQKQKKLKMLPRDQIYRRLDELDKTETLIKAD